jgi:hypothetical protein
MISRSEAVAAVEALLLEDDHDEVVVAVEEHERCWSLVAQSRAWVSSRDERDMLVGRGVFIVAKSTGDVHPTGSALPGEAAVAAFERWGDPHGPPPLEDRHFDLLGMVADGRGRRRTRALELYASRRGETWAVVLPALLEELRDRGLVESKSEFWALTSAGEHELRTGGTNEAQPATGAAPACEIDR